MTTYAGRLAENYVKRKKMAYLENPDVTIHDQISLNAKLGGMIERYHDKNIFGAAGEFIFPTPYGPESKSEVGPEFYEIRETVKRILFDPSFTRNHMLSYSRPVRRNSSRPKMDFRYLRKITTHKHVCEFDKNDVFEMRLYLPKSGKHYITYWSRREPNGKIFPSNGTRKPSSPSE
ncbi:MAG: hypothetical protein V1648_01055 [Candidatus Aenigmatarchaeota archaeon]